MTCTVSLPMMFPFKSPELELSAAVHVTVGVRASLAVLLGATLLAAAAASGWKLSGTRCPGISTVAVGSSWLGVRPLGVPTVLDRFIQQSVMQVLQGDWDPVISTPCCALAKPNRLYLRWRSGGDFN